MKQKLTLFLFFTITIFNYSCSKESELVSIKNDKSQSELVALTGCSIPDNLLKVAKFGVYPRSRILMPRGFYLRENIGEAMHNLTLDGDCEKNLELAYKAANDFLKDQKMPTIENPGDMVVKKQRLTQELNGILKPGDSFEFSDNVPANALKFNSVQEFQAFLNSPISREIQPSQVQTDGTKMSSVKYWIAAQLGYTEILIKLKKNSSNKYDFDSVNSRDNGISVLWSYNIIAHTESVEDNKTTIGIYGLYDYHIFIQGIGTYFKCSEDNKITVDRADGHTLTW